MCSLCIRVYHAFPSRLFNICGSLDWEGWARASTDGLSFS